MAWRDLVEPVRMERIAVVAPAGDLRRVLVEVADAGLIEPERPAGSGGDPSLDDILTSAVTHGTAAAILAWTPAAARASLAARLQAHNGAVVPLPIPVGSEPPTLIAPRGAVATFQPLVETYATVPYADLNPSLFAGLAYVLMFGMMFGDVGHGALLLLGGLALARGWPTALPRFRPAAPFVIGAGITSAAFGVAYGEAFGPTGLVPTLWLEPLSHPIPLLAAAVAAGAALLGVSYGLGAINRWRESGPAAALVALSGIAGIGLYLGLALVGVGLLRSVEPLTVGGVALTAVALVLGFIGLYQEAGGRAGGAAQAGIELFDAVVRLGANTVSFARLAAFGLTHAALSGIVWTGTAALWGRGAPWWPAAALVFVLGNAGTFALEALIAGIQALRLEYYELFSRIFITIGRRFAPWHIPTAVTKEPS